MAKEDRGLTGFEIAVIGLAGRFPGARDIDEFWENLQKGVESVGFWSGAELERAGISREVFENPDYVNVAGGVLEEKEYFDAAFFGYSPREAEIMDPQSRVLLECSWHALENAGYDANSYDGLIGIYAGASPNLDWEALAILSGKAYELGGYSADHLTQRDFFCARVAYKLNLKGPAILVQTACSTSLTAIHMACRALLMGECEIALAGGASIAAKNNNTYGYLFVEGMVGSQDGHCRAFDADARGVIGGDGAGIVVLKRFKYAVADRDTIHAVIKGSGVNNDGLRKIGFTAPSITAQAELVKRVQRLSQVEPASITYIEAHGTGTVLGDPIEVEALTRAFGSNDRHFCALGSVKTNIGHLDAAAGVAGFIKTVLALKHKKIPPSLNFKNPNPKIDFENSPFYVVTRLTPWENHRFPLRAAINSLGIGGTNAHVILEEAPQQENSTKSTGKSIGSRQFQLLLISAKTGNLLETVSHNLVRYLEDNPAVNIADAAYTLHEGRCALPYRRFLICKEINGAVQELTDIASTGQNSRYVKEEDPPVVFMFPGQGSQYVNMALDLYHAEPLFRQHMDRCLEILTLLMDVDIKEILYPDEKVKNKLYDIKQTQFAQPLIFCVEYALAELLIDWGITPYAMIGHSIGEYVAACLSGVFSLKEALTLVAGRGRLIQQIPPGVMLGVPLSEKEIIPLLNENPDVALAAVNTPTSCVISGPTGAVNRIQEQLKEKGIDCKTLHTSHAFHSGMMDPILKEFARHVQNIAGKQPQVPYLSNLTGTWFGVEQAKDPGYWVSHLRRTVRFNDGLNLLLKRPDLIFIEVGPGRVLSSFVRQHPDKKTTHAVVNLLPHPTEKDHDVGFLLNRIGELWLYGKKVKGTRFYDGQNRHRIPLPTYPFNGQRFWIDTDVKYLLTSQGPRGQAIENGEVRNTEKIIKPDPADTAETFYQRPEISAPYVAPRNEGERKIAEVWQSFFIIDNVGIYDNFFELGGDSLKAVQLVRKLKESEFEVTVDHILMYQTIENLCQNVLEKGNNDTSSVSETADINPNQPGLINEFTGKEEMELLAKLTQNDKLTVLVKKNRVRRQYPVSARQLIFLYDQEDIARRNLLFSYDFTSPVDESGIKDILERLISRNGLLRSVIELNGDDYMTKEFAAFPNLEIPFLDLSEYSPGTKKKILDLAKGKLKHEAFNVIDHLLYRVAVFKLDSRCCCLIMAFNHLVFDGESSKILAEKIGLLEANKEDVLDITGGKKDYFDYINFLNNQDYENIDLEPYISFSTFVQYRKKYLRRFPNKKLISILIEMDISAMNETLKDLYNEVLLLCNAKLINSLFKIDKVPLNFVSSGRNYKHGNFNKVIGDFHDVIPVLFSFDSNTDYADLLNKFRQYRRFIREKNLNFTHFYIKKYAADIELPNLDFSFNSQPGLYEVGKNLSNRQILEAFNVTGPLFNFNMTKDLYSDKIKVNIVQNFGFKESQLTLAIQKIYAEIVDVLNEMPSIS